MLKASALLCLTLLNSAESEDPPLGFLYTISQIFVSAHTLSLAFMLAEPPSTSQ